MRKLLVDNITRNESKFRILVQNVQQYILTSKMNKPGVWGTEIEILSFSILFKCNVMVYHDSQKLWTLLNDRIIDIANNNKNKTVYIQLKMITSHQ